MLAQFKSRLGIVPPVSVSVKLGIRLGSPEYTGMFYKKSIPNRISIVSNMSLLLRVTPFP